MNPEDCRPERKSWQGLPLRNPHEPDCRNPPSRLRLHRSLPQKQFTAHGQRSCYIKQICSGSRKSGKFRRDAFPSVKFPVMVPEEPSVKTPAYAMPSVPPFMFRTAALERLTLANRVAAFTFMPEEPLTARALL